MKTYKVKLAYTMNSGAVFVNVSQAMAPGKCLDYDIMHVYMYVRRKNTFTC